MYIRYIMSPPEVWGPAVWTLFHTLAEKINENANPYLFQSLFNIFFRICKYLPCPECSNDATNFLAKIRVNDLKTKTQFKTTFYIFHNYVNTKKRKPLFNFSYINFYKKYNLISIINNFISQYQTKGNMKLLNESFQRQFIIKDFNNWFRKYFVAFTPTRVNVQSTPVFNVNPIIREEIVEHKEEEIVEHNEEELAEPKEEELAEHKEEELAEPKEEVLAVTKEENIATEEILLPIAEYANVEVITLLLLDHPITQVPQEEDDSIL